MVDDPLSGRIVDAAIELAEAGDWANVRLREVAERLDVPLTEVLARFRDLDAVADAWFQRGWEAMLAPPPEDFALQPARDRVELLLNRWFDALAPHRRVTRQMLAAKLYPSHPHHWVPTIFNLSRTIHWLRDAAMLDAGGLRRMAEEVWLSAVFLCVLAVWLNDDTPNQQRTKDILRRRLVCGSGDLAARMKERRCGLLGCRGY